MEVLIALTLGFLLDLALGDPAWMPHPVRLVGRLVGALERLLRRTLPKNPQGELWGGVALVAVVCLLAFGLPLGLLWAAGWVHPLLRLALQAWWAWRVLAVKSLAAAGMGVYRRLAAGDLAAARAAVGEIVGRDTAALDEAGVARATVETLAENSGDGVVAPMLYFALGGAPLALLYKAVNTMDSMLGYKNEHFLYFGRAAARLDDAANFIPARLCGFLLVAAAAPCGASAKGAARVLWQDHAKHTSPNAAWPEAAAAGALGLALGGGALYGGKWVEKPVIGAGGRQARAGDIKRVNRLLYGAALLALALCAAGRLVWIFAAGGACPW